jgi:uncharacterized membrane protein
VKIDVTSRTSPKPILYLGDDALASAAAYLAGILSFHDLPFDYLPGGVPLELNAIGQRKLFVLSDYPANQMREAEQFEIVRQVEAGAGLLMIGGWESFHGFAGKWAGTPVATALPVHIARHDDRINCDQPALVRWMLPHPITDGLPWQTRPPAVGGFNRLTAKPNTTVLLEVERFEAHQEEQNTVFRPLDRHPLLVVGACGKGRSAALATDLAPHWVGGMVDWGTAKRIRAQAPGASSIEVGDCYARFVHNLIRWAGRWDQNHD